MIQALSKRFRQPIAFLFLLMFYTQTVLPLHSLAAGTGNDNTDYRYNRNASNSAVKTREKKTVSLQPVNPLFKQPEKEKGSIQPKQLSPVLNNSRNIGGPSSPETSTFKPVGSDNLVNLFTGDFSYSIPLLDVGGYPVNLFYNGGISMEQEASWVGLGWNINPGSVSRNMRGVPDDFDGTDILKQTQNVKPNKTWGGEVGADGEVFGIKQPNVNFTMGFSYNNYLGPELELGAGVSVSIPITKSIVHEKEAPLDTVQGLNLNLGANAKLSSRSGLTLSPSLNAGLHSVSQKMDIGVGLNTSYNSRTGIKDLNLTSQMTLYRNHELGKDEKGEMQYGARMSGNVGNMNSTISFARPSYVPTLRMPMQYSNYSGQLELGGGMFGLRGAGTLQGYYSESKVAATTISKPLIGFMYLEKANGRKDAVMDFNRVNDGEVTPNTPVISAPQYDYDIFNIQGEGTGGSIRAYRGDLGFMKDNETTSRDNNISIGFDVAPGGHYGGNWNTVSSPTRSGSWDDANNTLNQTLLFSGPGKNSSFENVYFRNPGEATVANESMINKIGKDNLVRFKLGGSFGSPRLESQLEQFSKTTNGGLGTIPVSNINSSYQQRDKRTQVITMLNADDASLIGLDKMIKSYSSALDAGNNLQYTSIPRAGSYRKGHHISEITVLEQSGMRYVYGLPVYNTTQQDFTFSVKETGDATTNLVNYAGDEPTVNSGNINGKTGIDGYVNVQQTPAYASSFLISGLLSPDYVDVTGDGITEDDLGNAVKFNYTMSPYLHKWCTPRNNANTNTAHFNIGLKTEKRDNKATISYGEREAWYMHSIESKSMIAIFKTSPRNDAKGVNGIDGMTGNINSKINSNENLNLKLDSILLYTKADIKANGLAGAIPLKTVHFDYSYSLCNGTPDNATEGKLTLTGIYFTFNGQPRASKNKYVFDYGTATSRSDNPNYTYNASDRWGTYKPAKDPVSDALLNPGGLSNIDYPYTPTDKTKDDSYAGAWSLKKILLPSGGQIEVQYEADDYAYVQNRRACNMFAIYGFGNSTSYTQSNRLYNVFPNEDQNYVYIQLPPASLQGTTPTAIKNEIRAKYLDSTNQLAFRLTVNMPKGMEPLTMYAGYDDYGLCTNSTASNPVIYIRLRQVNGKGALANSSVQFLINNLPAQAFPTYDLSEDTGLEAFFDLIIGSLGSIAGAFQNAEGQVRSIGGGSTVSLDKSFIRLCAPGFFKYGGGHRVKRVLLKDNWNAMSGQYTSQYGQDYDYTTTKVVNGVTTTISSGVASYEPGIGSEENPFREILQFNDKLPLASAQYGAIEMPILEGLYPSPVVGYSKVTVRSIHRNGTHHDSAVRSAIGKQVTEFYTAKDYPSFSAYTPMSNMDYHSSKPFSFLYKETIDRRTTSQGFLVETNDMHGKMKAQTVYSEGDEKTPLSFTYHTYKNTGSNGLNDKVDFVHNDQGGAVVSGSMGIDAELMTDVREFDVTTKGNNGQLQVDFFSFIPPVFSVFPFMLQSYTENKYRAVTTTKLINFHAIEDSVVVNDKGSVVSTKTIAYDAETGTPIVNKTVNEFNDTVFNVTYPAYWAYSGLSPAYKNVNRIYAAVSFVDGKITSGVSDMNAFESGDELYVTGGSNTATCPSPSGDVTKLWVLDKNKNTTALTVPAANKDLVFIDSSGNLFTKSNVSFRIVRSGKRNNLGATVGSVTAMKNPVQMLNETKLLVVKDTNNVVSTSAVVYKEKWQIDRDIIPKTSFSTIDCKQIEVVDCNGKLLNHINPYLTGLIGNFKPYRSYTYFGSRNESDPNLGTSIRKNGYIKGFSDYWFFDNNSDLLPDNNNKNWIWSSEITKVNSKGQEIETEDALSRYTTAQFGFVKNLPVAMTQNARQGESFAEDFEDNSYNETLNKATINNCLDTKYINFTQTSSSGSIIKSDGNTPFHSGKSVLRILPVANKNLIIPIAVQKTFTDSFNIAYTKDTTKGLAEIGVILSGKFTPTNANVSASASTTNSLSISTSVPTLNPSGKVYVVKQDTLYSYFEVPQDGIYNFTSDCLTSDGGQSTASFSDVFIDAFVEIKSVSTGLSIPVPTTSNTSAPLNSRSYRYQTACLQKGQYEMHVICTSHENVESPGWWNTHSYYSTFSISSSPGIIYYQSLASQPNCTFTHPLPATDSMFNQSFALTPGKKMQLSTWVQEDCGNTAGTPCYLNSYANNHLSFRFTNSSNQVTTMIFKPGGPIIEGWQRIDTSFTVPPDAISASMVFGNDGSRNVYFDDIRLHPFNANMKSYVYDPRTLRLSAELDENNYATFYDYDEEGQLIRVKKETVQGIKTIQETRSAKQKAITTIQ